MMTAPTSMSVQQMKSSNPEVERRRVHVIAAIRERAGVQFSRNFERPNSPSGAAPKQERVAVDLGRLANRSKTNEGT